MNPREHIGRADRMRADRAVAEAGWSDIRYNIVPETNPIQPNTSSGNQQRLQVLDNSGEQAHELLAAAIVSILTPDTVDWVEFRCADEELNRDDEVLGWLEDSSRRYNARLRAPQSGFATAQHEKMQDVTVFGTCGGFFADLPAQGFSLTSIPLSQLLLAENGRGEVDTVYRDWQWTADQAVTEWGDKVGGKVRQAFNNPKERYSKKFRFIHAVCPAGDHDPAAYDHRRMPFASTFVSVDDASEIGKNGYFTMPYQTARWRKRAEETYGRGCGHVALHDVRSLQRSVTVTIRAGERNLDPPLLAADDGIMSPVRTGNGRITYYRRDGFQGPPVTPLLSGARPEIGEEMSQGMRTRIDNAFMKPLIQMLRKDRMTATEVLQVVEEGQRVLGPYLGRLKTEDLGPMSQRGFDIMLRNGGFMPMPPVLRGRKFRVEYTSPAIRTQRIAQARGLAQFSEITSPFTAIKPELLDNIDLDKAYRDTGDTVGLPKSWFRSTDAVQQLRQQRADLAAQEHQRIATNEAVQTAANAAKALPSITQALSSPTEAFNAAA